MEMQSEMKLGSLHSLQGEPPFLFSEFSWTLFPFRNTYFLPVLFFPERSVYEATQQTIPCTSSPAQSQTFFRLSQPQLSAL